MNVTSLSQTVSQLTGSPLSKIHCYQLRLLQKSDASVLFGVVDVNRAYLRQWLPWLDETRTPNDSQAFIEQAQRSLRQNTGLILAIVRVKRLGIEVEALAPPIIPPKTIAVKKFGVGNTAGTSSEEADGAIAGLVSLDPIDWPSRTGYIGYWLAQNQQGQGIATQACKVLIDHAFSVLGLNRIVIACATENHRSRAIPERLGFEYDGRIRQAEQLSDRRVDHEVYVLLRDR